MKVLSTSTSKSDGTVWATIDVQSLASDTLKAYEAYKEASKMAAELRQDFEGLFRVEAGTDGIRFGYNYGKLSIAQGDAPKAKSQPKAVMGLDEFLSIQHSNGRAA